MATLAMINAVAPKDFFAHPMTGEFNGVGEAPTLHKEKLEFENVQLATRSYK